MADAAKEATDRVAQRRRRSTLCRRVLITAGIAIVVSASIWLIFALARSGAESSDRPQQSAQIAADSTVQQERRYSDKALGLDKVIDEYVRTMTPVDVQFRSSSDRHEYRTERNHYFEHEAIGHERERLHFERNLVIVFDHAYDGLPADLGFGGLLESAFEEAMDQCAHANGWADVQLYRVSKSDVEQFDIELGLSLDEFLDLRYECAQQAAAYPTLDPAVRDELLGRLREHYLAAAYEYLREFPHAEVPLVEHEGSPRPLEDWFISICRKEPEPAICAAEYRIELPVE